MSGLRVGGAADAKPGASKEEGKVADNEAAEKQGEEAAAASPSASAAASAAPSADASVKPRIAIGGRKPDDKSKPAETSKASTPAPPKVNLSAKK